MYCERIAGNCASSCSFKDCLMYIPYLPAVKDRELEDEKFLPCYLKDKTDKEPQPRTFENCSGYHDANVIDCLIPLRKECVLCPKMQNGLEERSLKSDPSDYKSCGTYNSLRDCMPISSKEMCLLCPKSSTNQDKQSVRSHNVGKSDYAKHKIQPWDIWIEYKLNPWDADIVKRVLRKKRGNSRKLDYEKIIHVCQERIRQIDNK